MQQLKLSLIPHVHEGEIIYQRATDGYVDATAMCHAAGKDFAGYMALPTTVDFLEELSKDTSIPTSDLIQNLPDDRHGVIATWVHPYIALNLGQWLSPKFTLLVSKWIDEWRSGSATPKKSAVLPYHLERYMANKDQIPHDHFSILSELAMRLIAPLESIGYTLPEHMLPDVSEGRMFCKWLRDEKGIDTNTLPKYRHEFPDGRIVYPKLYPIEILPDFIRHFHEVWLPNNAISYFKGKDASALPFLPKLLTADKAA